MTVFDRAPQSTVKVRTRQREKGRFGKFAFDPRAGVLFNHGIAVLRRMSQGIGDRRVSIQQLQQLVLPPAARTHVPDSAAWDRVEAELGVTLPDSLKQLCAVYGTGTFRGTSMTALSFACPGHPSFVDDLRGELQRLRDIRGPQPTDDDPFAVFPEENGILPLARDENDVWLCWVTRGDPENWPILVRWEAGPEGMQVFDMPLTELLVSLFERTLELPAFPLPTFVDDVQFLPYEAGKSLGAGRVMPRDLGSKLDVVSCGEIVGRLTESIPDMWSLEGRFTPAATPAGDRFIEMASAVDLAMADEDYRAGLRTLLREPQSGEEALFVVVSLSDDRLFGRRVCEPAAVRWVLEQVAE